MRTLSALRTASRFVIALIIGQSPQSLDGLDLAVPDTDPDTDTYLRWPGASRFYSSPSRRC